MRQPVLVALCVVLAAAAAAGQTPGDTAAAADTSALRVYLDCQGFVPGCDFDYFRTEITFVNYVRDRHDAQVHLLITSQSTGGGGREMTLTFIGLERFAATSDTLRYVSQRDDTDDEARQGLVQTVRLGLMRFVAKTPLGSRVRISYSAPPRAASQVHDPWNYWVFRVNLNGSYNGEESRNSISLSPSLSASRTTEEWKIRISINGNYRESHVRVPELDTLGNPVGTRKIVNISRNYNGSALVVNSLGPRWSVGAQARASHSIFNNQDLQLRLAPAVEFNVFPYSESTRRQLAFRYTVGFARFDYMDTTVYDKMKETLADQSLTVALDVKQPWGSADVSIEGASYLQDFAQHHVTVFGGVRVRVFRGLSMQFFASASRVKDQRFVAKAAGSTPEEILLQRRALETDFRYSAFFGLSYSFGSKFNNIVNPRFGDAGGEFFFFF